MPLEDDNRLTDLLDAAERVFNKYGSPTDWSEWKALRDALVAFGRNPLPMDALDPEPPAPSDD